MGSSLDMELLARFELATRLHEIIGFHGDLTTSD